MAQRVITRLIDDLDQESEATATVAFGLDGSQYEIDLTDAHAAELRDTFAPYVEAARRVGGTTRARTATPRRTATATGEPDLAAVRAWAREQGTKVSDRGRVSATVLKAYRDAH